MLMTVGIVTKHAAVEDAYEVDAARGPTVSSGPVLRGTIGAPEQVTALTSNLASFKTSTWLVKLLD